MFSRLFRKFKWNDIYSLFRICYFYFLFFIFFFVFWKIHLLLVYSHCHSIQNVLLIPRCNTLNGFRFPNNKTSIVLNAFCLNDGRMAKWRRKNWHHFYKISSKKRQVFSTTRSLTLENLVLEYEYSYLSFEIHTTSTNPI